MPSAAPTIPSINSQFPIHHDKWSGLDQGHPEMDLTGASSAPPGDMAQFGGDLNRNNALLNNRMQSFFGGGFGGGGGGGERTIDDLSVSCQLGAGGVPCGPCLYVFDGY